MAAQPIAQSVTLTLVICSGSAGRVQALRDPIRVAQAGVPSGAQPCSGTGFHDNAGLTTWIGWPFSAQVWLTISGVFAAPPCVSVCVRPRASSGPWNAAKHIMAPGGAAATSAERSPKPAQLAQLSPLPLPALVGQIYARESPLPSDDSRLRKGTENSAYGSDSCR